MSATIGSSMVSAVCCGIRSGLLPKFFKKAKTSFDVVMTAPGQG
jgi:hypothetical protein